MAQKKIYEISKKELRELSRMDCSQMNDFLKEIYQEGMAAGMKASEDQFDLKMAMAAVSRIKGIGPDMLGQIRLAMIKAGARDVEENPDISNNTGCEAADAAHQPTKRGLEYGA